MPPAAEDHPTRQRIVEAARRLFHEQGFHATGISTILREADVNSGSLYHYFASKEALLSGASLSATSFAVEKATNRSPEPLPE